MGPIFKNQTTFDRSQRHLPFTKHLNFQKSHKGGIREVKHNFCLTPFDPLWLAYVCTDFDATGEDR